MSSSTPVLLLLADISGYTRFMLAHPTAESHAREITIRLIRTLVAATRRPLRLAEIEGDAVFFYAPGRSDRLGSVADGVRTQVIDLFRAFNREVRILEKMDVCACEACSNVGRLRIKQVLHAGEVTIEGIGRFEKLFGVDVIVVHRLLKNTVDAEEYVLMTEAAARAFGTFFELTPRRHMEDLAELGLIETSVYQGPGLVELERDADHAQPRIDTMIRWRLRLLISAWRSRLRVLRKRHGNETGGMA